MIDRIMAFLANPDPSASKGPVAKKPKKAVKKVWNPPMTEDIVGCFDIGIVCVCVLVRNITFL